MVFDEVKQKNICLLSNRDGPNIIYSHLQSRIIFFRQYSIWERQTFKSNLKRHP